MEQLYSDLVESALVSWHYFEQNSKECHHIPNNPKEHINVVWGFTRNLGERKILVRINDHSMIKKEKIVIAEEVLLLTKKNIAEDSVIYCTPEDKLKFETILKREYPKNYRVIISGDFQQIFTYLNKRDLASQIIVYMLATQRKFLSGYLFENERHFSFQVLITVQEKHPSKCQCCHGCGNIKIDDYCTPMPHQIAWRPADFLIKFQKL